MAPNMKEIKDLGEYEQELNSAGTKLVVADFTAQWCAPCGKIAPVVSELCEKYPDVVFLKIDVDECKDVQDVENISAMPTFLFYKGKVKVDLLQGADPNGLETKIKKYHTTGAGAGDDESLLVLGQVPSTYFIKFAQHDLKAYLNMSESDCLNDDGKFSWENMFNNDASYTESDCDEQLLLNLTFASHVRLHSLVVQAPGDFGPRVVKLFANMTRPLDFDSADLTPATQELTFTGDDLESGKPVQLKYVKFQNLFNLTIFFKDNVVGESKTRINRLILLGTPLTTTQMKAFKRVAGKAGEKH